MLSMNKINIMDHLGIPENIEFEIAMIVYDKYNHQACIINEYLGEIYTLKDLREIEKAEDKLTNELRKAYIRGNYEEYKERLGYKSNEK